MNVWKLGCNWGSDAPSFYDFIKEEKIVITDEKHRFQTGDLIAITKGFIVSAIARVSEELRPVTTHNEFREPFEAHQIDYEDWVKYASAEWYELSSDQKFEYQLQSGIRMVQNDGIKNKITDLWEGRNNQTHYNGMNTLSLIPLNRILYGPPGTGKTYHTVNRALEILGEEINDVDRDETKELYHQKVEEGRIVFTTFHQSMNYEDFIEGIKPQEPNQEGDPVTYKVEDGIFKKLCVEAAFALGDVDRSEEAEKILDFSALYDQYIEELEKDLSKGETPQIKTKSGGKVMVDNISSKNNIIIKHSEEAHGFTVSKKRLAKLNQAIPDLHAITNVMREFDSVIGGSNTSAYWAVLNDIRLKSTQLEKNIGQDNQLRRLPKKYSYEEKKEVVQAFSYNDLNGKNGEPYVLIIDEINRGNVSQIFGELITLIEEDKRLGNREALEVTLPYSKETFGVPPNLYIIGTMNTADRSVEALDTALRRRFSFIEMPPQPELITPLETHRRFWIQNTGVYWGAKETYDKHEKEIRDLLGISILDDEGYRAFGDQTDALSKQEFEENINALAEYNGIDLSQLLICINKRIEKLLDHDHLIGHSYFMHISSFSDLKAAFKNKIIPLLQEYFYGDYGKIGLVLGEGFFNNGGKQEVTDLSIFANFNAYDPSNYLEKPIYRLKNVLAMGDGEFRKAIDTLLNK